MSYNPIDILLVEDDPGDVELIKDALSNSKMKIKLTVVEDGIEAYKYMKTHQQDQQRPHMVFLDLNLPKKDGGEVLQDIKTDDSLKTIPVIVLTTSDAEDDIRKAYERGANSYITKPVGLDQFAKVIQSIEDFWFSVVKLPVA